MILRKLLPIILALALSFAIAGLSAETCNMETGEGCEMLAPAQGTGFFGVVLADMTEEYLEENDYPYDFGVLVESVVEGSPAEEAGVMANDVITFVDDTQIADKASFLDFAGTCYAGQTVTLGIYRDADEFTLPVTLAEKQGVAKTTEIEKKIVRGSYVGFGGGTWIPMWFNTDLSDVNDMISQFGFSALGEDGILLDGGIGKGNIGKGFFLGGLGATYTVQRKKADPVDNNYNYWMRYTTSMGGVTLDKRFPIFKGLLGSVGVMLGVGEHTLELAHNNGQYDWADMDSTLVNSANTYSSLNRSFALVQPRAELLVAVTPWFGIRGEVGYAFGYSGSKGWMLNTPNGEAYEVSNSPDTPFKGVTVSIGPWFGF